MASEAETRIVIDALFRPGPIRRSFDAPLPDSQSVDEAIAVVDQITGRRALGPRHRHLVGACRAELASADLTRLASWIDDLRSPPPPMEAAERYWSVFAPSIAGVANEWDDHIAEIRSSRSVAIAQARDPIAPGEVLFTSNALVGPPIGVNAGPPDFWFDHPVPIGAPAGQNEIVHGLTGLDDAIAFERARGTLDGPASIVVSVSPTHRDLVRTASEEVRRAVHSCGELPNLEVYMVDEGMVRDLLDHVLAPAIGADAEALAPIGVLGPYGRHFTFLKAVSALWQVAIDPTVRATFKIDLDQVFPQEHLIAQFGRSALELMTHEHWGALAIDADGTEIELGMIAGSLVNADDLARGLLVPDATFAGDLTTPDLVACKRLAQAVSTEAEMMDDGSGPPRQRIHVTGGVSGIRIDALRRSWPFTPSFIGRAEDQAYQMATFDRPAPALRTLHAAGLVMRHDSAQIARTSAGRESARTEVADLERIIVFSAYAQNLGISGHRLWPFTGAFISELPSTVAVLRLALRTIEIASDDDDRAGAFLSIGMDRLDATRAFVSDRPETFDARVERERTAWALFSVLMDEVERDASLAARVRANVEGWRIPPITAGR